jgi:hypothetical protein
MNRIPKRALKLAGVKTSREFKQLKRSQIREAIKAVKKISEHSPFYLPSNDWRALSELELTKHNCSIKNWGR